MAVSKAELTEKLTRDQKRELEKLESQFDKKLREDYSGSEITIGLKNLPHERVQEELKRRYKKAGWKIKFESEQRNGDWVSIK
jgi:sugar-specific transcriptional regulator TrmB